SNTVSRSLPCAYNLAAARCIRHICAGACTHTAIVGKYSSSAHINCPNAFAAYLQIPAFRREPREEVIAHVRRCTYGPSVHTYICHKTYSSGGNSEVRAWVKTGRGC